MLASQSEEKENCNDVDWKTTASLYSQKFLSYLVLLISILIIHLQIFFNIIDSEKTPDSYLILLFILFLNATIFIVLFIFCILVYRTSLELYAIEIENKTIPCIFQLVQKNIKGARRLNLYNTFTSWFKPQKRGIGILFLIAIIILIISDLALSFFIAAILLGYTKAVLVPCSALLFC